MPALPRRRRGSNHQGNRSRVSAGLGRSQSSQRAPHRSPSRHHFDCGSYRNQAGSRCQRQSLASIADRYLDSAVCNDFPGAGLGWTRRCGAVKRLFAIACIAMVSEILSPARGAVSRQDLATVEVSLPANAAMPLELRLQGEDGATKPLRFWLGATPSIWVLADYTCETLCGPTLSIVSDALAQSGLRPGVDFRLVAVGLDPKDTAADAANM